MANEDCCCFICKERPSKRVAISIDGERLDLQPDLCQRHCDEYIFKCGEVLGEMLPRPTPDQIREALERAGFAKRQ